MRIVYFILAIALLNGCKRTPSNLAHQIASADHIVVRYRFAHPPPQLSGIRLSVSGDKVHEIVKAVSSATHEGDTLCAWPWELQFYRNTNRLAIIDFQGPSLLVENVEYWDKSGVLAELDREILRQIRFKPTHSNTELKPKATAH